jgi:hypothetical protein
VPLVKTLVDGRRRRPVLAPSDTHAFLAAMQPIGLFGEIEDVVDAVLYLDNATFVTGAILDVDGGANAGRRWPGGSPELKPSAPSRRFACWSPSIQPEFTRAGHDPVALLDIVGKDLEAAR